jgi:hypothetical protein
VVEKNAANILMKIDQNLQAFHEIVRRTPYGQTSSKEFALMPEMTQQHFVPCGRYQPQALCRAVFIKSG